MKHTIKSRPFLKWAGNKYRLLDKIITLLPHGKRLIEPFVGSGAVFLNTDYDEYLLGDCNHDLIQLYNHIKKDSLEFIPFARQYFISKNNQPDVYYHLRKQFNVETDPFTKSALFIYLNRHGYNGLCRYNQKGLYNVPFGRYRQPYFPETEIKLFAEKSKRCKFYCTDFSKMMKKARVGDMIYCDPPYVPLNMTAYFTSYSKDEFDNSHQEALALLARQLSQKSIPVLISNHDVRYTRKLYKGAKFKSFQVPRHISCKVMDRQPVKELLALFS